VDLFLVHWPDPSTPLEETFRGLNELVGNGSARRVGVSNFDLQLLQEACALSDTPVATDQVEYNLLERGPARSGLLEYCRDNGILLTAYEPLAKGRLLSHPGLRKIGEQSGLNPAQLALVWLLRQEKVITIPMSSKEVHLRENLLIPEIGLSEETFRELDALA
jgi:diketogulonate reductase-like aldo/keto reductase